MADMNTENRKVFGVLAEFKNPRQLSDAAAAVERSGYKKYDAYAPFPIHGLEKSMGIKESPLGWIVLCGGLIGATGALVMMIWMMGFDYPMNISGKPFVNLPAYVPITFELTVLLSAFAAVFGMLGLNGLPRLHHPLFEIERFKKATDDGFFICVESSDLLFAEEKVSKLFSDNGATHIETVYDSE